MLWNVFLVYAALQAAILSVWPTPQLWVIASILRPLGPLATSAGQPLRRSRTSHRSSLVISMKTRSAARRTHRALVSDDVGTSVLSFLNPQEGVGGLGAVCRNYRELWRRRCVGLLRYKFTVASFSRAERMAAYEHGVIIPDYMYDHIATVFENGLQFRSPGDSDHLNGPNAIAPRGDGTMWVLNAFTNQVICVRVSGGLDVELVETQFPNHVDNPGDFGGFVDLAVAGDRLLVFCYNNMGEDEALVAAHVRVYDNQTGAFVSQFGVRDSVTRNNTRNTSIAAQGDMLYITCYSFDGVDVFNWREGRRVRTFGSLGSPYLFDGPFGIAVRGKKLYVSEEGGRRIQILSLPDDDSAEPEILQVIPSPDGEPLGGLCLNGDTLWCLGVEGDSTPLHLLGPCYE